MIGDCSIAVGTDGPAYDRHVVNLPIPLTLAAQYYRDVENAWGRVVYGKGAILSRFGMEKCNTIVIWSGKMQY